MSFYVYSSQSRPTRRLIPLAYLALDGIINAQIQIIHDPYKDQFWHGIEELEKLQQRIFDLKNEIISEAKTSLSQKIGKSSFESWMTDMLEKKLHSNTIYQSYLQLTELLSPIIIPDGWLVYWGW